MDAYNLAIMFGPALMRPLDDDMSAMLKDMNDQSQIVESLIRHVSRKLSFWLSFILSGIVIIIIIKQDRSRDTWPVE